MRSVVDRMKTPHHFRHAQRSRSRPGLSGAAPLCWRGADDHPLAEDPAKEAVEHALPPAGHEAHGASESALTMTFFEDLRVAREGLASLGFWALQVYRLGHLRYRFQSRLVRYPLAVLHLVLAKLAEMLCGVTIGVSARIGRRLVIEHSGAIVVHGLAVIGDDCIIRQGVTIGNRRMDRPLEAPQLGHRVNVGAGAKILGAVRVGDDADIGANAVVITDVPAGALAVGVPARIILRGQRHDPS
jgi:serine O-acetyltransferase